MFVILSDQVIQMMTDHKGKRLLLIEPFFSGSHKQWAEGLKEHSSFQIDIESLPGRHWKWRMHGAALTFAERLKNKINDYDLIIVTDMLDLATFRGLINIDVPVLLYFHENQLAYPWSETDQDREKGWDRRYVWINFTSAMAADHIWFNSEYNKRSFLDNIPSFLQGFPDHKNYNLNSLDEKSVVVPLGIDLEGIWAERDSNSIEMPTILWNHRWEYDKNPDLFFQTLFSLSEEEMQFNLVVLGTRTGKVPAIFAEAEKKLARHILQFGEVKSRTEYITWIKKSDILPVTSNQDFFGISVVEAIAAGVVPLLPKGLAFEEHLDPDNLPELFYSSRDEYYAKLKNLLLRTKEYYLAQHVASYDWKKIIATYDEMFHRF